MKNLMITSAAALLIGTTAGAALPTQAEEAPEESLFQGIQIASLSDHWDWVVASLKLDDDSYDEDDDHEDDDYEDDADDRYEDNDDDSYDEGPGYDDD
ncbi:MAG: hypothetical protein OXC60_19210 [Litoreibacter sp.]|nr:hypothetical protein [Litoreibacter sp.]